MLIDVNVSLGRWPFQTTPDLTAAGLARQLSAEGITHALVSPLDAVLAPDPDVHNRALIRKLRPHPALLPVPVVNPSLANWRAALTAGAEAAEIPAVKILPNYHNYALTESFVADMMAELARRKLPLLVQMRIEDERNQHPLFSVPGVEVDAVVSLAGRHPDVPIVCLCAYYNEAIRLVQETSSVYVDIAFVERLDTLSSLLAHIPAERVLFGSHTPVLYTRAAVAKVEFAEIDGDAAEAVRWGNGERVLRMSLSDSGCQSI